MFELRIWLTSSTTYIKCTYLLWHYQDNMVQLPGGTYHMLYCTVLLCHVCYTVLPSRNCARVSPIEYCTPLIDAVLTLIPRYKEKTHSLLCWFNAVYLFVQYHSKEQTKLSTKLFPSYYGA